MRGITNADGSTGIKETDQQVPKCPECGHTHDEISFNPQFECAECGSTFNAGSNQATTAIEYLDCANCDGGEILRNARQGGPLVECAQCRNLIAVRDQEEFLDPKSLLQDVCSEDGFTVAENDTEQQAAHILTRLAYNDESSFRRFNPDTFDYMIKCVDGQPCGYLSWNTPPRLGFPLLNQIWVDEDSRREGHAESLVEKWCDDFADESEMFFVESPSQSGKALFDSLSNEDGEVFGKEWEISSSM